MNTIILSGRVKMNGQFFSEGQIVHVKPSEATDFLALENTTTLVIKSPSVTKDKYDGECDGD